MTAGEIGAVYRLPSGKFAFLRSLALDGCWQLDVVDPHRAQIVDGEGVTFSPAMADRLSIAWHAAQWAGKVRDRVALNERIARQAREEAAEKAERSAAWRRAQERLQDQGGAQHAVQAD